MEKLTHYRSIVQRILTDLAEPSGSQSDREAETVFAFDEQRDQYLLLNVGWSGNRRVRGTPVYIRLRGGKIWIEDDWTDQAIALKLVEAGVPKDDIVLAFHPPGMRKLTEFAVA